MAKTKQQRIEELEEQLARADELIDRYNREHQYDSAQRIKAETGLSVWLASNSANNPVCIGGRDVEQVDEDLGVSIYHQNGIIRGVEITDGDGNSTFKYGFFPADFVDREIRFARGERVTI
jgi:hypothetical protein